MGCQLKNSLPAIWVDLDDTKGRDSPPGPVACRLARVGRRATARRGAPTGANADMRRKASTVGRSPSCAPKAQETKGRMAARSLQPAVRCAKMLTRSSDVDHLHGVDIVSRRATATMMRQVNFRVSRLLFIPRDDRHGDVAGDKVGALATLSVRQTP